MDIIDLTDENVTKSLDGIMSNNYEFTFSFQGVLNTIKTNNNDMFLNMISNRNITYIVDNPTYNLTRLKQPIRNLTVLCVDRDASKLAETFPEVKEAYYMPLAGIRGTVNKPVNEREIDVLFTGTYTNPDILKSDFVNVSEDLKSYISIIINYLISNTYDTLDNAQKILLKELNIQVENDIDYLEYVFLLSSIDSYVRAYFRDKIIRLLVDSGIKVHVYGNGWAGFKCKKSENLVIHEPLNYMKTLDVMGNSKIVLNIMPWFKDGFHDRIPCAMLNGAVCVTDSSKYIEKKF